MSSDRLPCSQCGAMILELTSERNGGLCAPCKLARDQVLREAQRNELRKNPPKTLEEMDFLAPPNDISKMGLRIFLEELWRSRSGSANFSKKSFPEMLKKLVDEHAPDGKKVSIEFLQRCEPVLQEASSLINGLKKIPRPYREAMAVYQLWGMITSDGLESYLENTNRKFDCEVELGLKLFNRSDSRGALERARKAFDPLEGLPEGLESQLEDLIYRDLHEFESTLLGPFLIQATLSM
jgi:hypothetical protein